MNRHLASVPYWDSLHIVLRTRILIFLGVLAALIGLLLGFGILTSDRSSTLTIASGPVGGPSWQVSQELAQALIDIGYQTSVIPHDETLRLIELVDDPDDPVDIAFLYNSVNSKNYPYVDTLGTIGKRPIILVSIDPNARILSISDLKGSRIDVGPVNSAKAALVTQLLAVYGITSANSTLVNMPTGSTLEQYQELRIQVITDRFGDANQVITALREGRAAQLIPIPENEAVAGFVPSAQAMTIPRGGLSLDPIVPLEPFPTIGQMLTVIGRENLNPAAAYAVAQALTRAFGDSTAFSAAGEYPNFADRQLPVNPYAADFYNTGQIPWQYQHLPPILADSLLKVLIPISLILIFSSVYSIFLPEFYSLWNGVIRPRTEERLVASFEAQLAAGKELTLRQRQRLSDILAKQDAGRAIRQRVEAMRAELSEPVSESVSEPGNDEAPDRQSGA